MTIFGTSFDHETKVLFDVTEQSGPLTELVVGSELSSLNVTKIPNGTILLFETPQHDPGVTVFDFILMNNKHILSDANFLSRQVKMSKAQKFSNSQQAFKHFRKL